ATRSERHRRRLGGGAAGERGARGAARGAADRGHVVRLPGAATRRGGRDHEPQPVGARVVTCPRPACDACEARARRRRAAERTVMSGTRDIEAMTLEQLEELLDTYGPARDAWPEAVQGRAE